MAVLGRLRGSRASRIIWGLLAVLMAAGLLGSTVRAGKALTDEKGTAEQRAVSLTNTVLVGALTPQIVSDVIVGPDYRSLSTTVQGKILADSAIGPDAMTQVRIWKPDGTLIFSTAQRDKIGEFVATGNPQIEQALAGNTVSLLTDAQVAPKAGLQGSQERLYETFVPLHLPSQTGVLAVVQINTRYAAITAAADRVWRPVQIGSLAGLVIALLLFVASLRTRPAATAWADLGRPAVDLAEADKRVRLAEQAAAQAAEESRRAQEVADQYQEKLAASEQRLRDSLAATRGIEDEVKEAKTRIPTLEAELQHLRDLTVAPAESSKADAEVERLTAALKESQLERWRGTQEVRRVLETVAALEAELAETKASLASGGVDPAKTDERVRMAEARAAALEAEVGELSAQLSESGEARAALEAQSQRAAADSSKSKEANDKKAANELTKAQQGLQEATAKLAEVQQLARNSEDKHVEVSGELAQVRSILTEREQEFAKAQTFISEREAEVKELRDALAAKDAEVARAAEAARQALGEEGARTMAANERLAAAEARATAAESSVADMKAAADVATELEPKAAIASELETRVRELEDARRKDIVELQTAQERLANSQAELIAATRRAKDAEEKLKHAPSAPAETPAVAAGRVAGLARKPEEPGAEAPSASDEAEEVAASEEVAAAEEAPEAPSEAESLRSRLTRAAAARHRPSSTPPSGSSG